MACSAPVGEAQSGTVVAMPSGRLTEVRCVGLSLMGHLPRGVTAVLPRWEVGVLISNEHLEMALERLRPEAAAEGA